MKTLHTNYKLDSGDITLTVVVGNGQRGNTLVAVGSAVLANGPNISNLRIGKGSDLVGSTLSVISTVSQVNTSTPEDRDYQLDDDFADGEVQIQFVATFDLTE